MYHTHTHRADRVRKRERGKEKLDGEGTIEEEKHIQCSVDVLDAPYVLDTYTSHVDVLVYAYGCVGFDVSSFCFHMMLDACVCVGIRFHSMSSLWSLFFFHQFIYWYSYIHSGAFNIFVFLLAHILSNPINKFRLKNRQKKIVSLFLLEISFVFHKLLTITLVYGKHERDVDVILWQFFPKKNKTKSI